jgi:glycosyltransferase involved in cell wall biosynthesis
MIRDRQLAVCLISEEYPPETGWGGIGTYSYNLANGLVELGHRVHVVARTWAEEHTAHLDGVQVHRVSVPEPSWHRAARAVNERMRESREVVRWSSRAARTVHRIAADERLDVVESPEYHAQALATSVAVPRLPVVVRLHTPAFLDRKVTGAGAGWSRPDTMVSENLERMLTRRASVVTSPSRQLAKDVARHWALDLDAVRMIRNPIDDSLFRPRARDEPDDGGILYVGRLSRRKGVRTLVDALPRVLERVPGARAMLVGRDHPSAPGGASMAEYLRGRVRELAVPCDAVAFSGPVDWQRLPQLYRRASVCVVPSLYENCPYTCIEAMASGSALVATAVGAVPEIVSHGVDGLLVPPDDPGALADAVSRLLTQPELRTRLGAAAREKAEERFGRRPIAQATAQVYAALAERNGR